MGIFRFLYNCENWGSSGFCWFVFHEKLRFSYGKSLHARRRILAVCWDSSYPWRLRMTGIFFVLCWVFPLFLQEPGDTLRRAIGFLFRQSAYKSGDRFCKSLVRLLSKSFHSRFPPGFFSLKMLHWAHARVLACCKHPTPTKQSQKMSCTPISLQQGPGAVYQANTLQELLFYC